MQSVNLLNLFHALILLNLFVRVLNGDLYVLILNCFFLVPSIVYT